MSASSETLAPTQLEEFQLVFDHYKSMAERAMQQVSPNRINGLPPYTAIIV